MLKKISLILCVGMLFGSCYRDKEEELYPNNFSVVDTNTYYYAADIKPLIATNCVGCHNTGIQSPDLSSYAPLKANIVRVEVRAVLQRTMPAAGMSIGNVNKLRNWIAAGALNN